MRLFGASRNGCGGFYARLEIVPTTPAREGIGAPTPAFRNTGRVIDPWWIADRLRMNEFSKALAAGQPIRLSDEADFSLGYLRVQPSLRVVRWDGGKELLEPRVMQVLVALACAKESVVSRDGLIERCWGGRIVGEASINRCISKLRELAASGGPNSFTIETVPRVGYRLMSANEPAATVAATDKDGAPAPTTVLAATAHSRRGYWLVPLGAALLAAAFALYALQVFPPLRRSPTISLATQQPSIAVLPFKNWAPTRTRAISPPACRTKS